MLINKRARHDYEILEKVEAGLALLGLEVKTLRLGRGALVDAHVVFRDGEAYLINMNLPGYTYGDLRNYEPTRSRKLLLHKKEIESLQAKTSNTGLSVVPLSVYLKRGSFKVELGVVRGKKQYQKKEDLKKRDLAREVRREFKQRLR